MRKGVRLINCARGGIYDEAALVDGLKSGQLGGVALDVFTNEPCTDSPLFGMPNVLCTPHLGASTEEAQTQVAVEGVEPAGRLSDHRHDPPRGQLHADRSQDPGRPARLSRRGLSAGPAAGPVRHLRRSSRCTLNYRGEVAGKNTRLITAAFAAGLLEHALEQEINIVNAEVLLRERGIELIEQTRGDKGAFSSMVAAGVTTETHVHQAAGTTFGLDMLRLVQLDDYRLDAYLDGVLLVFNHRDVPGIIGVVGTIFGRYKVNIAQMAVGRASKGGEAIGVLNLDQAPPQAALDEVLAHEAIERAVIIKLPPAGERPAWMSAGPKASAG